MQTNSSALLSKLYLPLVKRSSKIQVTIPIRFTNDLQSGLDWYLSQLEGRSHTWCNGTLIATTNFNYNLPNPKTGKIQYSKIFPEDPSSSLNFDVKIDAVSYAPLTNTKMIGKVTLCNRFGCHLTIFKHFHAKISAEELRKRYKWDLLYGMWKLKSDNINLDVSIRSSSWVIFNVEKLKISDEKVEIEGNIDRDDLGVISKRFVPLIMKKKLIELKEEILENGFDRKTISLEAPKIEEKKVEKKKSSSSSSDDSSSSSDSSSDDSSTSSDDSSSSSSSSSDTGDSDSEKKTKGKGKGDNSKENLVNEIQMKSPSSKKKENNKSSSSSSESDESSSSSSSSSDSNSSSSSKKKSKKNKESDLTRKRSFEQNSEINNNTEKDKKLKKRRKKKKKKKSKN
ncbi:DNA-directed RNA polymerase i subunit rpa43 [Anaeramoeba flamelloides]|uniref:DNA-directed RNA polymerase i subunit rpa43 n=1 Tax=Anaeramoeba flamelloides TaxID=1746091 RepID=A0AAV7YCN4_9EUKA|nr:DNA-directed RNA polymerase i subunit rpa43 [Anaeramoeba flamelloides]